ncbi:MAG: hypothetical protein JW891_16455 [Candidatus Lokiarchaeota archaeon]|nr:hypothetical protein [Candidatus Lokiarchaeota archaeon]
MNLSADYDKILEESLKNELKWHVDELDELYGQKRDKLSKEDIISASQIISTMTQSFDYDHNENVVPVLLKTIEDIRTKYPRFF